MKKFIFLLMMIILSFSVLGAGFNVSDILHGYYNFDDYADDSEEKLHGWYNYTPANANHNTTHYKLGAGSWTCDIGSSSSLEMVEEFTPIVGKTQTSPIAVSFWVIFNTNGTGAGAHQTSATWGDGDNNIIGFKENTDDFGLWKGNGQISVHEDISDRNGWHHVFARNNGTANGFEIFLDGVSGGGATNDRAITIERVTLCAREGGGAYYGGITIDEVAIFNDTVNDSVVAQFYNSGDAWSPIASAVTPININISRPSEGEKINDFYINVSLDITSNCSINDTYWSEVYTNGTIYNYDNETVPSGNYSVKVNCSNADSSSESIINFTVDSNVPSITHIFPASDNSSLQINLGNITVRKNFSDNFDLYSYVLNITNGTDLYFNDSLALSGATHEYVKNISTGNWSNITYYTYEVLCDSHTATYLEPAREVDAGKNILEYNFTDTRIRITSNDDTMDFTSEKQLDRYKFTSTRTKKEEPIYMLTSDTIIKYLDHTGIKGHFVIGNYWVDFEQKYPVTVEKINNYFYMVTVHTLDAKIDFNSIGALNCISEDHSFTLSSLPDPQGNYSTSYIAGTGWFNTGLLDMTTIAGVMTMFFIFFVLVAGVVMAEVLKIPAVVIVVAVSMILTGFLFYSVVSAVMGFFVAILGLMYIFRGIFLALE